jgi:predicted MPP superfamily phosphohydrolase
MTLSRRQFLKKGLAAGAAGLMVSYPFFIERNRVMTNHYRIPVPHLPSAFSGLRIVHLTDLHYGPLVSLGFIRNVIRRANALDPDVTVLTGDYVHGLNKTIQIDTVWPEMARLSARFGVFSVLGNHDHWADTKRSMVWMKKTGQNLRHKKRFIEREGQRLWFAGAGDFYADHRNLDRLLQTIPEKDCRIVLAHSPDSADSDYKHRIDLMISGHTHGGQVVIPLVGPPVLPTRNKTYSSGLKRSLKGENVFISRGIGWAKIPLRFNCPPEIAVLELVPDVAANQRHFYG